MEPFNLIIDEFTLEVKDKGYRKHFEDILSILVGLLFIVLLHVDKESVLLRDLLLSFEMIDHLSLTVTTQILKSDSFREGHPFEVEESISTCELLPIACSLIQASLD